MISFLSSFHFSLFNILRILKNVPVFYPPNVGKTHARECASMLLKHIFSEVKDEDYTYMM